MAGVARITLVGNLGRDPETSVTPDGRASLRFTVAVNRKRGAEESVAWYSVTAWGGLADSLEKAAAAGWLAKGRTVFVEGRLEPREWTDKNGAPRTSLDVAATEVQLVGGRAEGEGRRPEGEWDDVPF